MITTVNVPRINTNDDKVAIVCWHVDDGAQVEAGQDLADVETSKAVVTITADAEGYVRQLLKPGTIAKVGAPFYRVASEAALLDSAGAAPAAQAAPAKAPAVAAMAAVAAAAAGVSAPVIGHAGGQPPLPQTPAPGVPLPIIQAPQPSAEPAFSSTRFSQSARALIQQLGLNEAMFTGAGLVTAAMVKAKADPSSVPQVAAPAASLGFASAQASAHTPATPTFATHQAPGPQTVRSEPVPLGKLAEIGSLTTGESGNINSLLTIYFDSEPIRTRLRQDKAFDGNIQPVILYEVSRLLKQYPNLTAYFADDQIHYYDRIDLGLAMDMGKGLKVATIKAADTLMPVHFHEKTIDLGMRYLENRLRPDELLGSTFTITDLSGSDILHFHPLINGRQSAIMGLGADSEQPGYPMSIAINFDHRVSNGREVGAFLKELRARLLSYAPERAAAVASAPAHQAAAPLPTGQHCDVCGVEREAYFRDYGSAAHMLAHFREDGTIGSVCHRCWGGWT